jgi:methanogenic corrinoid protein MtbC1
MCAAVEGEQHVVALDMAAKLLDSAGYDVLPLGADVPTDALPTIVADFEPTVFALSATMPENQDRLRAAVDVLTGPAGGLGLILGGASVPPDLKLNPQVVVEPNVAGVVEAADALVRRARLN